MLFLHGDGDIECLFPTSRGESNTFTFAADRLELKVQKPQKGGRSSSNGAAGSSTSSSAEALPIGTITSEVLDEFLKEYIKVIASQEVDAVSSGEEEKERAAQEKKARKEAEKAAKKAAKSAEKAAKKARKAQEREEAIQKEADYEALQALNKKRAAALGGLAPLKSEPSKYARGRVSAPTPRTKLKDQLQYVDDADALKAESEARVQKAREIAAEKRAIAKAEREQRERERADRKAIKDAEREKKRLEDAEKAAANAETEAQARKWAEEDALRAAQEKEAQRERKRAMNAKRKEAEAAAKAVAEEEEAQRRAQELEEDAAFKQARAEEVAAYEQRRKARAKKAKQEAAAKAAEEAEATARKQNELAKLRRPNRLKKGSSSVTHSQFQRVSYEEVRGSQYGDDQGAFDNERNDEGDDQVGALPASGEGSQSPSSDTRQGFWGRAFSGGVDVLGARRTKPAINLQPPSARTPSKRPLPRPGIRSGSGGRSNGSSPQGQVVAPHATSYRDLMAVQGQRQTFAEYMASKQAIEGDGAEKREDVSRGGELFTREEFVLRYGREDGARKWNDAAEERRVDAADGCGYTREEFIEE